jgi:hypothetical protein
MKTRHRRRRPRRTRRRQRGGIRYKHDCRFDPYTVTDLFSNEGLIWNVKDHPEWVLKEVVNPVSGAATAWANPASVEVNATILAAKAGIAPSVIATKDCGTIDVSYEVKGKQSHALHSVGWIVMEKVQTQSPPAGETHATAVKTLQSAIAGLGIKGWDAHAANVLYGTTVSHPSPKWWAIDFGTL